MHYRIYESQLLIWKIKYMFVIQFAKLRNYLQILVWYIEILKYCFQLYFRILKS
jgi:hypothetical protein